ncbi:MAG: hypothetical protein ABI112_16290 [Terracoccus sp.]
MSVITQTSLQAPPVRDLRTTSRWFAAVLMPAGPLAVAGLRFAMPYNTTDSVPTTVAKIATHPSSEGLVLWLSLIATLTLVPGALAAIKLSSRGAPILSATAALLIVPAYLSLYAVGLVDYIAMSVTVHTVDPVAVARIADFVNQLPTTTIPTNIFVVGHVFGSIVLAVALWRSRQVKLVGCLVLGVSQPIHFAAAVTGNHVLDLIGWTMTAAGMAFAARAVIALHNEEWSLPPTSPVTEGS